MKYSIVIPVHDNVNTIYKCLQSAIEQDFDDFEIIISDTSKNDQVYDIIKPSFCNRIRYYRNDFNWTMWDNHNFLIEQSKGDYIFFLHSDDYLLSGAIKKADIVLKRLNYPNRIFLSGTSIYKDFKNVISFLGLEADGLICGEDAINLFSYRSLTPSGTIFSSDIKEIGGFIYDGMIFPYSDCWTELKLCLNGYRFYLINDILFIRNSNGTNFKYGNRAEIKDVYYHLTNEFSKEQIEILKNSILNNFSLEKIKFFMQDPCYRRDIRFYILKRLLKHPFKNGLAVKVLLFF